METHFAKHSIVMRVPSASLCRIWPVRRRNFIPLILSRHIVYTFQLSSASINRPQVLPFSQNSRAAPVTSLAGSASLALANFHRLPPDRLSRHAPFPHRTLILSLLACRRPLSRSPSRTMNAVSAFISYPTCAYYQINARQRDTH